MPVDDLHGRTVLVTGSARNLGLACALRFASLGAAVAVNGRRLDDALTSATARCRALGAARSVAVVGDVSLADDVDRLVSSVEEQLGPIDVYVNTVGLRIHEALPQITLASWDLVIRTNLTASFLLARRILPGMAARGWGRAIHTSGAHASSGAANRAHNVAAKAGLHGLTKALAIEYAPHGVTVNAVCPGAFDTDRSPAQAQGWDEHAFVQHVPMGRLGEPNEYADACAYLASDGAAYVTGHVLHVNGGLLMV